MSGRRVIIVIIGFTGGGVDGVVVTLGTGGRAGTPVVPTRNHKIIIILVTISLRPLTCIHLAIPTVEAINYRIN